MQNLIFYPMGFYVLYIWSILIYAFLVRKRALSQNKVSASYFKTFRVEDTPEYLIRISRHLDNQFQAPVIFLISSLASLQASSVNITTLVLAWGFVLSRILHTYIHLGSNKIFQRAIIYAVGWLMILGMWLNLMIKVSV